MCGIPQKRPKFGSFEKLCPPAAGRFFCIFIEYSVFDSRTQAFFVLSAYERHYIFSCVYINTLTQYSRSTANCRLAPKNPKHSGKAQIDAAEEAKLIPANIREGITVLGVLGTMSGSEGMKPQAKNVTPTFASQEILPDEEYNCLSSVTVAAIPIAYTDNAQGGKTVTIG